MRSSSCASTVASTKKSDPCVAKMSVRRVSSSVMGLKMFIEDRFVVVASIVFTLTMSVLRFLVGYFGSPDRIRCG